MCRAPAQCAAMSIIEHYNAGLKLGLAPADAAAFAVMVYDILAVLDDVHKDYKRDES